MEAWPEMMLNQIKNPAKLALKQTPNISNNLLLSFFLKDTIE